MVNNRPKRVTGFMALARQIVTQTPGLTAQQVVEIAKRSGKVISAATNPDASLVATLHKSHHQFGLERRGDSEGRFRYYPKGIAQVPPTSVPAVQDSPKNGGCCIHLSPGESRQLGALLELGIYTSEHDAHCDLVKKGLEAILSRLSA